MPTNPESFATRSTLYPEVGRAAAALGRLAVIGLGVRSLHVSERRVAVLEDRAPPTALERFFLASAMPLTQGGAVTRTIGWSDGGCDTIWGVSIAVTVQIRRLPSSAGLDLPTYMTGGAAGMDLYAAV